MNSKNNRQEGKDSKKEKENAFNRKKKLFMFVKTLCCMAIVLFIVFSYVYQSTKQIYLNYQIVNLNKQIDTLNIKLSEAQVDNENLKTNATVEKLATENLGMSYAKSDKIVIVKEQSISTEQNDDNDKRKIKIFMKSLYEETYSNLKTFNVNSIAQFFNTK